MNALLTTDLHLTDNPSERYRWSIFKFLLEQALKYDVNEIYVLGDLVDRRDRHSANLLNQLIEEFSNLQIQTKADIFILAGNHDRPLTGPYYWKFLNKLGIPYITKPQLHRDKVYLLPFAADPTKEWKELNLSSASVLLMHQTGQGASVERGYELVSNNLPKLPAISVYSGDVHRPQEADGITYVGTPHPIKFSESWNNRVILIQDDKFTHPVSIWLPSIKRAILDIKNSKELENLPYKKDDQLRIRYHLNGKQLTEWPMEQTVIKQWAIDREIHIASLEAVLIGDGVKAETNAAVLALELMKPEEIVTQFGKDEKLSEDVIAMGVNLIKSV